MRMSSLKIATSKAMDMRVYLSALKAFTKLVVWITTSFKTSVVIKDLGLLVRDNHLNLFVVLPIGTQRRWIWFDCVLGGKSVGYWVWIV